MNTESSLSSPKKGWRLNTLLPADTIRDRIAELAEEIDRHYAGREALVVVVLRGAFVFAADLIRLLSTPVSVDFVRLESYGENTCSNGEVRLISDTREAVDGREVLVVEDIIDTGYSIDLLLSHFHDRGASDVRVCALLDKPSRREVGVEADFVGFTIPNVFVAGYGIDFAQSLRNLPDICAVAEESNH